MATETITIQVDAEAAKAYKAASEEDQKKMQALLNLWLKEITTADTISLKELMSEISKKAQERGLTPEILKSILDAE